MRRYKIHAGESYADEADYYLPYPVGGAAGVEWIQVDSPTGAVLKHNVLIGAPILIEDLCPDIDPEAFAGEMEFYRHMADKMRQERDIALSRKPNLPDNSDVM